MIQSCLLALLLCLGSGCEKNQDQEDALVAVQYAGYTTARFKLWDLLMPRAHASVSGLQFCFKRLRFKMADEATVDPALAEDNIDFSIGEVTIDPAGTSLGAIVLPVGTYRRVEFDLENDCASGYSVQLVNSNGSFNSTDRITIKWNGNLVIQEDTVVSLNVQTILDQLNSYNGAGSLKDAAEAITGSL